MKNGAEESIQAVFCRKCNNSIKQNNEVYFLYEECPQFKICIECSQEISHQHFLLKIEPNQLYKDLKSKFKEKQHQTVNNLLQYTYYVKNTSKGDEWPESSKLIILDNPFNINVLTTAIKMQGPVQPGQSRKFTLELEKPEQDSYIRFRLANYDEIGMRWIQFGKILEIIFNSPRKLELTENQQLLISKDYADRYSGEEQINKEYRLMLKKTKISKERKANMKSLLAFGFTNFTKNMQTLKGCNDDLKVAMEIIMKEIKKSY